MYWQSSRNLGIPKDVNILAESRRIPEGAKILEKNNNKKTYGIPKGAKIP